MSEIIQQKERNSEVCINSVLKSGFPLSALKNSKGISVAVGPSSNGDNKWRQGTFFYWNFSHTENIVLFVIATYLKLTSALHQVANINLLSGPNGNNTVDLFCTTLIALHISCLLCITKSVENSPLKKEGVYADE